MRAFKSGIKRLIWRTPLGPPLRTAWRRVHGITDLRDRPIHQTKAEITRQSMNQLHDFLISGAILPFARFEHPLVSVIMVLYNRAELTFRCIRSLKESSHLPLEIIAINNGSSDLTEKLF